jgi:hypothetical protein
MRAWNWQDVAVHEAAHTAATAKKKKNWTHSCFMRLMAQVISTVLYACILIITPVAAMFYYRT